MDKVEGRRQIFLNMRARSGQCISMLEVAQQLSDICGCPMAPVKDSRCIVNGEYHTVHFVEDMSYEVLYGAAKITKEQEKVSGDNYTCNMEEGGRFVMCLSDGMGSGMDACKESEVVVELLEQFMNSGFSQETAAKMVNSSAGTEKTGWNVFYCRYLCAGFVYRNLQFSQSGGSYDIYQKRSLGGGDYVYEPGSGISPADRF